MRRAGLRAKVARLERQSLVRRFPKVCAAIYDIEDDYLLGVEGWLDGVSIQIARLPGEALQELAARAFTSGTVLNLAAIYAPRLAPEPPQHDVDQMPMQTPETAPGPFVGIPGVGRIASLAELQQMGSIPVPPERLIN